MIDIHLLGLLMYNLYSGRCDFAFEDIIKIRDGCQLFCMTQSPLLYILTPIQNFCFAPMAIVGPAFDSTPARNNKEFRKANHPNPQLFIACNMESTPTLDFIRCATHSGLYQEIPITHPSIYTKPLVPSNQQHLNPISYMFDILPSSLSSLASIRPESLVGEDQLMAQPTEYP